LDLKNKETLLIFLRAPEKGRVKTRLASKIGEEKALALYKGFVQKALSAVETSGRDHCICFFPENRQALVEDWLGPDHAYMPQAGDDLGQRMGNALSRVFDAGACKAVLVGTDVPDIRAHHLLTALDILDQKDVVIGPSVDGGYWLIGFRREGFCRELFCQMAWGTKNVFSATMDKARILGMSAGILPTLQDIDTLEDLIVFCQNPGGDSQGIENDEYPVSETGE